jgi:CDP-diglyceride synthetase
MELAIQKLAIVSFFVIGLSHIFQPRVWAKFFIDLRSKGEIGSFINAFIHFPLGALIVAFHNVWQGIPTILTLIGYGWVLKSLIYFVLPSFGLKSMSRVSLEKSWEFIIAGVLMLVIGGLVLFSLITRP